MTQTTLSDPLENVSLSLNTEPFPNQVAVVHAKLDSRVLGLEWLRAGLTIAVLMFHSAVPYLLFPFPGLRWASHEPNGSALVDACGWVIAAVAMPTFFILSGFLSARIYASRGANGFFGDRSRRLLPALAFGALFILPVTGYVWFLSWAAQGFMPLDRLLLWGIPDDLEEGLYGAGHFWFLELLWIFCFAVWAIHHLLGRLRVSAAVLWHRGSSRLLSSFAMPFVFAVPGAIVLAIQPRVAIGFQHTWEPQLLKLLYYTPCFAAGFWLCNCRHGPSTLIRWCEARLLMAACIFAVLLPRIYQYESIGTKGFDLWWLVSLFSVFAWLGATGLIGACLKYLNRPSPHVMRQISHASLWIYMVHVPIVGLLQVDLLRVPLPLVVKFLIVVTVGLILSLASFYVARGSWIGRILEPKTALRGRSRLPERVPAEEPLLCWSRLRTLMLVRTWRTALVRFHRAA